MATVKFTYARSDEPITDEWFERLQSVDSKTEYGGGMYWLSFIGSSSRSTTLLEVSACGTKYRYVHRDHEEGGQFQDGYSSYPSHVWLNPDALIHQGVQPLPFSWRT